VPVDQSSTLLLEGAEGIALQRQSEVEQSRMGRSDQSQ